MFEWVETFKLLGELLVPYATLVAFSLGLSYLANEGKHILSHLSFLISSFSFLLVVLGLGMSQITVNPTPLHDIIYLFLSIGGLVMGITALATGLIFYIIPFEKVFKIKKKR